MATYQERMTGYNTVMSPVSRGKGEGDIQNMEVCQRAAFPSGGRLMNHVHLSERISRFCSEIDQDVRMHWVKVIWVSTMKEWSNTGWYGDIGGLFYLRALVNGREVGPVVSWH
jgi:hypothetical protein